MEIQVIFLPEGREVYVLPGTPVIEAAARAGLVINSPCGGKGTCGKCRIEFREGMSDPTAEEKKLLSEAEINKGVRLACQSKIVTASLIYIPFASLLSAQRILETGWEERKIELDHLSAEETADGPYGLAFDLGTTTLVGTLLHMGSGRDLAVSSRMNPQSVHGDDVISRINFVLSSSQGLDKLHHLVVKIINEMIDELTGKAKVDRENIQHMTVAGNSTMQHIFLKVSPGSLGSMPFSLVVEERVEIEAEKLGIMINPQGTIFVFPNIAGFVGGDTVSVILATGLSHSKEIRLMVDIGTNGEIVLGNRERLLTASTAAGPAFEGSRISQGMRAAPGAIEKVVINEEVEVNVIGDVPPSGICGTGLIDAVAEMLRVEIVDMSGRIVPPSALSDKIPGSLRRRVIEKKPNHNFLLVDGEHTQDGNSIFITQKDVRELQLAKGAIAAGVKILRKELGIEEEDISQVLLAGAFGNFIRRRQAKKIGLIPNLPSEKICFVGNAASSGAKLALLSPKLKQETETISKEIDYIELSGRPDFQDEFAQAMMF